MSDDIFILDDTPKVEKPKIVYDQQARVKAAAQAMARTRAMIARKVMITNNPFTSWADMSERARIPLHYGHAEEFNYHTMCEYLDIYCKLAGEVITSDRAIYPSALKPTYSRSIGRDIDFGGFFHKPQQEKALTMIIDHFWNAEKPRQYNGLLLPLDGGDGKGVITAVLSRWLLENPLKDTKCVNNIIIITPKSVKQSMIRKLIRAGIPEEEVGMSVVVLSYNDLASKVFKPFFVEHEEIDSSGNKIKRYTFRGIKPSAVFIDECQKIKKDTSRAFRYLRAFIDAKCPIILTSATPAVTVADCKFFALASGMKDLEGQELRDDSWPTLARHIARGNPSDPDNPAMTRFNEYFAPCICRPPKDPRKIKATNILTTEEMPDDPEMKRIYYQAERDWLEAKKNAGEHVSERGMVMARFQILRAAAELLSVDIFVERIRKALADGFAPVVGVTTQTALREIVLRVVEKGILPREKIGVIWGGKRDIKVTEVYTDNEYVDVASKNYDQLTRPEKAKLKLTREYMVQRCRLNLTVEENEQRTAKLRALQLFKQNEKERQDNMDQFQSGQKECMVFTLQSGGTGIDLDHQYATAKPRRVFLVTCYYAEEFLQGLWRCIRTATLTDVVQEIIVLANTIAALHVVPILERKIGSIRTLAAGYMDLVTELEKRATFADLEKTSGYKRMESDVTDLDEGTAALDAAEDETSTEDEELDLTE